MAKSTFILAVRRTLLKLVTFLDKSLASDSSEAFQTFRYRKPGQEEKGSKEFVLLGRTDDIRGAVHVLRDGGGESLHSHSNIDGFWFVLSGQARFHGKNGVVGEFSPGEGIVTPRNTSYWFECTSEEDLELLQVLSFDRMQGWDRQNHAPPRHDPSTVQKYDGRHDNRPY
ncbi:MAG: cupin domain-containing protein [Pseudomonadota bacterium]